MTRTKHSGRVGFALITLLALMPAGLGANSLLGKMAGEFLALR